VIPQIVFFYTERYAVIRIYHIMFIVQSSNSEPTF